MVYPEAMDVIIELKPHQVEAIETIMQATRTQRTTIIDDAINAYIREFKANYIKHSLPGRVRLQPLLTNASAPFDIVKQRGKDWTARRRFLHWDRNINVGGGA
tara:strand:+ start:813 stop:1121 length:309 start_codon:yes stop_codon:yes gene_type:complete